MTPFHLNKKERKVMNKEELLKKADHTLLKQNAVWEDIKTLCDDAEQIYDGLQVDERENFSSYYRMLQRLLAALR